MADLRWGIIGSTGWSDAFFAPAVNAASGSALSAVLSREAAKAEAFCQKHGADAGFDDLEAFLAADLDVVWVASPNGLHAEQAVAALRAGKHVLCEKPMALDVPSCEKMLEVADASGQLLSIGYHMRHVPAHRSVIEAWQRGDYGTPVAGRAQLYFTYPELPDVWRLQRDTSGGWALGDIGTHLVDLMRWAFGDVTETQGLLANPRWGFEVDDLAVLTLRFKNGAVAIADASTGASGPPRVELYGSEGWCVFESSMFGSLMGDPGRVTRALGGAEPATEAIAPSNPYQLQVEAFGRAVRGEEELRVSARDGLENIRVLAAARGY